MKKEWLVRTLVISIAVLFIATGLVSAFKVNLTDESKMTIVTKKLVTTDNHPPDAPKVTGPYFTKVGIPYKCIIKTIDPDGDNVSYQVDWGDGATSEWTGWYLSGEEITQSHNYSKKGHVSIRVRAKDIHNATGDWGYWEVVIPKSKQIINLPFLQFLERFPNAFQILRYVLEGR